MRFWLALEAVTLAVGLIALRAIHSDRPAVSVVALGDQLPSWYYAVSDLAVAAFIVGSAIVAIVRIVRRWRKKRQQRRRQPTLLLVSRRIGSRRQD